MLNLVVHILIAGPKGVSRFYCVIATLCGEVGTENLKLIIECKTWKS